MRIAYIISAYKQPRLLLRMMDRLNCDATSFLVHVDRKTDQAVFDRIVSETRQMPNVYLLDRHACYWGGFGHVRVSIKGINELFQKRIPFDYAILLTGQDYPIKTNRQIQDFFDANHGRSFLDYFPLPAQDWDSGGLQRVQLWHIRWHNHYFVFPRNPGGIIQRKFPFGVQIFGGSSYWCLTKECVEYIYRFINTNPGFVNFFKYVDVPDEIFFQTIVMNSPHAQNVVNDDMRYIDWKDSEAGSPAILVKEDLGKLAISSKLFARKFDENVDPEVLDLIDQQILGAV